MNGSSIAFEYLADKDVDIVSCSLGLRKDSQSVQ